MIGPGTSFRPEALHQPDETGLISMRAASTDDRSGMSLAARPARRLEMSKTILLIHGAWLTPNCWDSFRTRFEARGHRVLAPPWPLQDGPSDQLRESPHQKLGALTIGRIVDHYQSLIRALPEPPIVMGHGFGGLFVEMLVNRGAASAGVAICPAPARGILPTPAAFLWAMPALLSWQGWNRTLNLSFRQFSRSFVATLPPGEQRAAYERFVVPTPGRPFYQAAFGNGNHVDFAQTDRAPLLLIGAEQDRIVPVSMVQAAYDKYSVSDTITEITTFPHRTHFLISMPGWEEVADHAIKWAITYSRSPDKTSASRASQGEQLAGAAAG
jgi:pimeloyl-ACP methyl ester carboxylesterase